MLQKNFLDGTLSLILILSSLKARPELCISQPACSHVWWMIPPCFYPLADTPSLNSVLCRAEMHSSTCSRNNGGLPKL